MDFSLNGVTGTDYSSVIRQTQATNVENSLNNLDKTSAADEKMMEACKEFEAYMIEQVYKQMEKTIMKSDDEKNEYEEYFGDMRIQQYAKIASDQGGFGLAQQLYEAMKTQSQAIDPSTLHE